MNTLPLTVLFHDGPIGRAYLVALNRAGWQPAKIIHLVNLRPAVSNVPGARWLPRVLRLTVARKAQQLRNNHWPRRIRSVHPNLVSAITAGIKTSVPDADEWLATMYGSIPFRRFAAAYQRVPISNWRDPALADVLVHDESPVLFTGGGIVPASLLRRPDVPRFLHVHPGHLPDVRGADGLLWSTLLRNCPGYSCFQLAPGIDEGPIILAGDLPHVSFTLPGGARPDDQTLYRALYAFCDPLLRARQLLATIEIFGPDARKWPATPQRAKAGVTYHFMHADLRRIALQRLFATYTGTMSASTRRLASAVENDRTAQGAACA